MKREWRLSGALLIWTLALWAAAGCGYRFTGGGSLPENVTRVSISVLKNATSETGLENTLTNDLIYEMGRNRQAEVTDTDRAQARVAGIIRSVSVSTVTHSDVNTSQERRVSLTVDLEMTRADGTQIWQRQGITANETFAVGADKFATEQNRKAALKTLSRRLAERIYASMTDNF